MRALTLPLLFSVGLLLAVAPAPAQTPAPVPEETLTKFNLSFPGGTPGELVRAIEKAMGKPLNLIVQPDDANLRLPELRMTGIDVAQLFATMSEGSVRPRVVHNLTVQSQYVIRTIGKPSDSSVWFLVVQSAPPQEKSSSFYLLTPYLERGLTVNDITTAIQTAWRMRGAATAPAISYHQETNLLIAVGDRADLETINMALSALNARQVVPAQSAEPAKSATKSP